jgi:hypothetical protein
MTSQIDQKRAVGTSTLEGEIIDAKFGDLSNWLSWKSHDTPENGDPTGRDAYAICDPLAKPTARRQAKDLNKLEQSCCHPGPGCNKGGQTLREDFSWAGCFITEKLSHRQDHVDGLPSTGQISQSALIPAVNTPGNPTAHRACTGGAYGKERHAQRSFLGRTRSHLKARRQSKQRCGGHVGRKTLHVKER